MLMFTEQAGFFARASLGAPASVRVFCNTGLVRARGTHLPGFFRDYWNTYDDCCQRVRPRASVNVWTDLRLASYRFI
jgi:hypothetical protein